MSQEKHLVQLRDDVNALTIVGKRELLVKNNLEVYVFPVKHMQETSKMCKLFSEKEKFRFYGSHFFRSSVPCILNAVEQIKPKNKVHYVSLVLLMVKSK